MRKVSFSIQVVSKSTALVFPAAFLCYFFSAGRVCCKHKEYRRACTMPSPCALGEVYEDPRSSAVFTKRGFTGEKLRDHPLFYLHFPEQYEMSPQHRTLATWLHGYFIFSLVPPISHIHKQAKHWLMPACWKYVRQSWSWDVRPPFSPAWFMCHPYSEFKIWVYRMQKEESQMLAVKLSSGTSRVYF